MCKLSLSQANDGKSCPLFQEETYCDSLSIAILFHKVCIRFLALPSIKDKQKDIPIEREELKDCLPN
ncbi:hypothetical protein ACTXT7_007105 [Hymenolepis weldensis]